MANAGLQNVLNHINFEPGLGYLYLLPFHSMINPTENIFGVSLFSELGPFIEFYSDTQISEADVYRQVSKVLSIQALIMGQGVADRNPGSVGGFYEVRSVRKEYGDVTNPSLLVQDLYNSLCDDADSFQIQSRFTLSRAYALSSDFESSCIEFFKIVELYVKHLAYSSRLSPVATDQVKGGHLFRDSVKKDIIDKGFISTRLFGLLENIIVVRNFFVGHGGVRPVVGRLFDDPEFAQRVKLFKGIQERDNYDLTLNDYNDSPLFRRIGADFSLLSRFIFCKLQGISPVLVYEPMCWWGASSQVLETLRDEGAIILTNDLSSTSV